MRSSPRTIGVLAVVLASSCGWAPADTTGLEPCDTAFRQTWTPSAFRCKQAQYAADEAQLFLTATGVATDTELRGILDSYSLVMHPGDNFEGPYGVASGFTGLDCIQVGRGAPGLVHELLHALEPRRGVLDTASHPGWTGKGYWGLDDLFSADVNYTDVSTCGAGPVLDRHRVALEVAGVDVGEMLERIQRLRPSCPVDAAALER